MQLYWISLLCTKYFVPGCRFINAELKSDSDSESEYDTAQKIIGYNNYGVVIKNFTNDFFSTFSEY